MSDVADVPPSVLVVEDEADFRELLVFKLQESGLISYAASHAAEGLLLARAQRPSVVILDVMLPDLPGTELCKAIRSDPSLSSVSILMLTAKGEEIDRVLGFELGADDYVVKPCSIRELLLRIRSLIERAKDREQARNARGEQPTIKVGALEIDPLAHRACAGGQELQLTPIEFKLLQLLASNPGRAFPRKRLLEEVWRVTADVETRTVDAHVKRLREKLGALGDAIETIRGVGYRLRT